MNLFYQIFLLDILLMAVFFGLGYYAVKKEQKDNWGDKQTMEFRKSRQLAKEWEKTHPILDFFQGFYYELRRKKDIPREKYNETRWFIQRGQRGYSDCDVWGFYHYLTNVIIGGLKDLEKQVHGAPCGMLNSHSIDIKGTSKATKEWKKTLNKMIWTFEAIEKVENHEWIFCHDESKRKEYKNYERRLNRPDKKLPPLFEGIPQNKWHLMTKKEMEQYREGWKLFEQHFIDLWD